MTFLILRPVPDDPTPTDAPPKPADASAPQQAEDLPKPRPKGEPANVVKVREMVEATLVPTGGYLIDDHGNYVVGKDSARTFIVPTWIENGAAVVRVFAITNVGVPVTAELTRWLLKKNLEFVFGAFALDVEHGAVWFNHNLLGDFTAPPELEATISAVIETADRFDDEIKTNFGGRLYVEGDDAALPPPSSAGYL